ncbi:hypothetical protein [Bradyrhizobium sp. 157]|nr:hypothetical protein [Bradyrhizobium sp. 157]
MSNRVVQDWDAYIRDNTMSTTILDRSCTIAISSSSTDAATA